MISKKQMILSKVRMDIEKKLEQGETVGFNVPITTTTGSSHNCEDNKVLKKRKLSLDTSVAVVGAVSVDDIMTPKDHIHPSEFTQDSSTMMISSSSSSTTTTMTTVLPLSAVHPAVATAAVVSAVKSTRNNNNNNSVGRPRANSGATTTTTNNSRSRRSSSNGVHSSAVASAVIQQHQQQQQQHGCAAGQVECCIKGCDNPVTNRLRFSLRCLSEDDFKPEFIQKSFNKVCHYHYFADLYRYKKANKAKNNGAATTTGATTGATTTTTSVTTTTGAVGAAVVGVNQQKKKSSNDATKKRSRNDFEQHHQGVTSNSKPSALSLPTSVSHAALFNPSLFAALAPQTSLPPMMSVPSNTKLPVVSFASNNNSTATSATPLLNQCKAVTPVSCQDASVFFNFVGLGQVPTNTFQTRAM